MKHLLCLTALLLVALQTLAADLRLGIIGLDTSHVTAFTSILNDPKNKNHIPGAKVVAAFKGGSKDIENSVSRIDKFTEELTTKYGVKLYPTIEEMCQHVDAVLLESVDGRPHLAQARPVILAGKPLFIDKPMTASLKDAREIFRLAKERNVPVFSSSSLRFGKNTQAVRHGSIGKVLEAETTSPASLHPTHPDLFWYGIHGVESLFTVMGTGCESVTRTTTADGKIEVTGTWAGGRKGVFRESKTYGGKAKGEKGSADVGQYDGYAPLLVAVVEFLKSGKPPVSAEETLEILAFMEAADLSKARSSKAVALKEVFDQAAR
jgi:predicted dehydrogenase